MRIEGWPPVTAYWLALALALVVTPANACDEWPKVPPVGRLILEQSLPNGLLLRQWTTNGDQLSNYGSFTRTYVDGSEDAYPLMFAADFPHGHPLDDGLGPGGLNGFPDVTYINVGTTDRPPPCTDIRLYHKGGPRQGDAPAHTHDSTSVLLGHRPYNHHGN